VLDVVIEPGAGSPAGGLWGGERGRTRSAHASWEGSRCASVIYDWTRPTDAEVLARSEMNFHGVVWDGQSGAMCSKEEENIQSMDWALKM
jgi:hypothetical protein